MTRNLNPLCDTFVEAGLECGYLHNADFNEPTQEGFGLYQNTAKNVLRMSAARAYPHPVRGVRTFESNQCSGDACADRRQESHRH